MLHRNVGKQAFVFNENWEKLILPKRLNLYTKLHVGITTERTVTNAFSIKTSHAQAEKTPVTAFHPKETHFSLWRMVSSGLLRRVALVRTDVSEEPGASMRVTKIGALGTTQAATSNRRTLRRNTSVTSQKTPFFIVTAVKTSNLTHFFLSLFVFAYICTLQDLRFSRRWLWRIAPFTPCGSCKNRRFGLTWRLFHQGDKAQWTLAVSSSRRTQRALFLVHRFLSP
jgi:hypothetical protein